MVTSAPLRLQVQVVVYKNSAADIWRMLWGLCACVRQASERVALTPKLAIGDCSPTPVLQSRDVEELRAKGIDSGLDDLSYEFFNSNLGSSGGHNRLADDTENDLLLVLNPDTYPAPNMLIELIARMEDPSIGVAEARQIPIEHPKEWDLATGDTSWSSTCCVLVRRPVFDSVSGFDHDHFPLYCDDVDFSWRVRLEGQRVVFVPRAVVFHNKSIALNGSPEPASTELYHGTIGRLMLATRYRRPDIFQETVDWIENHGVTDQKVALARFRELEVAGKVPDPVKDAESVAQFIGGEYARHRF